MTDVRSAHSGGTSARMNEGNDATAWSAWLTDVSTELTEHRAQREYDNSLCNVATERSVLVASPDEHISRTLRVGRTIAVRPTEGDDVLSTE